MVRASGKKKKTRTVVAAVLALAAASTDAAGTMASETVADSALEAKVEAILKTLTHDEKMGLIGGQGPADIVFPEKTGLARLRLSDATLGIRLSDPNGPGYPAGPAIASSWNLEAVRRYGEALAKDAKVRGLHGVLGPGFNLNRSPFGGRNAEYLAGEDPFLGASIAATAVAAMQAQGVWAMPKHFILNDTEVNRGAIDQKVDERTLRELYLPPFEAVVRQGGAASIMTSYPRVNGEYVWESRRLVTDLLKKEWGFRGFVASDWVSIQDGVKAALAGMDIEFPAAIHMNPRELAPAFASGRLSEADLDDKVRRILRQTLAFGFDEPRVAQDTAAQDRLSDGVSLDLAREGIVLLKNHDDLLPLVSSRVKRVAVIGDIARSAPPTLSGSAAIEPARFVSELEGIRAAAPSGVRVDFLDDLAQSPQATPWHCRDEKGRERAGLRGEYFTNSDLAGAPEVVRVDSSVAFRWKKQPPPVSAAQGISVRWSGEYVASRSGDHAFRLRSDKAVRLFLNDVLEVDNAAHVVDDSPAPMPVPSVAAKRFLKAGERIRVRIEYRVVPGAKGTTLVGIAGSPFAFDGVEASVAPLVPSRDIAGYDAVILAVGLTGAAEGEGNDHDWTLPEFQADLIREVAARNPRTVVVMHGGGALETESWRESVPALLQAWYPGPFGGQALGEILFGAVNPSGKLPISFPARIEDTSSFADYPHPIFDHSMAEMPFSEGMFLGYRGEGRGMRPPLFPFGHGLSYTRFAYSDVTVVGTREDMQSWRIEATLANVGSVAGAETAQLYIAPLTPQVDRPVQELKGFAKVFLNPGESRRVSFPLNGRSFAVFDPQKQAWRIEGGDYLIKVGSSSRDIRATAAIEGLPPLVLKPSEDLPLVFP